MMKWATSLVLILVLGGSALAGVPIHFGAYECGDMDCCATAQASSASHSHNKTAEELATELCCIQSCPAPSTPARTGAAGQLAPSVNADNHPVAVKPPAMIPNVSSPRNAIETHPQDSNPIYIRHLALLI